MRWAALALLVGCAPTVPYTNERPVVPFKVTVGGTPSWFVDGGPTVLTVRNPTSMRRQLHVVCEPTVPPDYIDRGHIEWWTCLDPGAEKRRLVEFPYVDSMTQVCRVAEQWPAVVDCVEDVE